MPLGDNLRKQLVRVKLEGALSPRQLGLLAGTAAKKRHDQLVAAGVLPVASIRYVDGVANAAETAVKITQTKPGIIEYRGSSLTEAALYAWTIVREASGNIPKRASQFPAGTFAKSWRMFIDGREVDPSRIPQGSAQSAIGGVLGANQVIIVNVTPYSRFLEQHVGLHRQRPAYMITEIAQRATKSKFQGLSIRRQFVTLSGASSVPFRVPYYLQGREGRLAVLRNQRRRPRADRLVGSEMTYPAVIIATRGG
jgi:hypothetical protein